MTATLMLCALWFFVGWSCCAARSEREASEAQRLRDEAWDLRYLHGKDGR